MSSINELAEQVAKLSLANNSDEEHRKQRKLQVVKLVAEKIKSGNYKNIIVLSGAGLSTAAGNVIKKKLKKKQSMF